MTSRSVRSIRRERGPTIAWAPRHDAYYVLAGLLPGASEIPALALTQAALLEVESLRRRETSPVIYGVLAGNLCVDPRDKVAYLMVDEVVRARTSLATDDPTTEIATEVQWLAAEVLRREKLPIGWYLEGLAGDGAPDPELLDLHAKLFPEAWQFMLLCDDKSVGARDVLIRLERRSQRSYAIPFLELLPRTGARGQAELRTAIRWTNYITSQQVLPLATSEAVPTSVASSGAPPNVSARFASWLKTPFRRPGAHDGYRRSSPRGGSAAPPQAAAKASAGSAHSEPAREPRVDRIKTPIPGATPAPSSSPAPISGSEPPNAKAPADAVPDLGPPKVASPNRESATVEPPKVELLEAQPPSGANDAAQGDEGVTTRAPVDVPIAPPSARGSHELRPPREHTPIFKPEPPRSAEKPTPREPELTAKGSAPATAVPADLLASTTPPTRQSNDVRKRQPDDAKIPPATTRRIDAQAPSRRRTVVLGAVMLSLVLSVGWYMTRTHTAQSASVGGPTDTKTGADEDRARIMQLERDARALVHTDGCSSADACRSAPVGWRECGGPRLHLIYCAASTDTLALFHKLNELRQAEMTYNEKSGRTGSICDFRMPPELVLQSGGRCIQAR